MRAGVCGWLSGWSGLAEEGGQVNRVHQGRAGHHVSRTTSGPHALGRPPFAFRREQDAGYGRHKGVQLYFREAGPLDDNLER